MSKPISLSEVARVANDAHERNERARDAIMTEFGVTRTGAGKLLCKARKAGYDISNDATIPLSQPDRMAMLIAWLSDGRPFDPMPWKAEANCKNISPHLFFPEKGDTSTQHQAIAVCRHCTVRWDCLEYGLRHSERGVWGGTTERQRIHIRRGWLHLEDIA